MRAVAIMTTLPAILLIAGTTLSQAGELSPVPDRLVVLTFDDGNKSDIEFVAPLLKRYGFGATFFVSDCAWFQEDKKTYMTWEEVRKLHATGFEVGNHTRSHPNLTQLSAEAIAEEVEYIERLHREHGLPRPTSFCYPGYHVNRTAVEVVGRGAVGREAAEEVALVGSVGDLERNGVEDLLAEVEAVLAHGLPVAGAAHQDDRQEWS